MPLGSRVNKRPDEPLPCTTPPHTLQYCEQTASGPHGNWREMLKIKSFCGHGDKLSASNLAVQSHSHLLPSYRFSKTTGVDQKCLTLRLKLTFLAALLHLNRIPKDVKPWGVCEVTIHHAWHERLQRTPC